MTTTDADTPADVEGRVERFQADTGRIREEISQMIVGHRRVIDGVMMSLLADGHVLLEGVPGLGKTMLVKTLARALDLEFSRIQFTPDLMPSDIVGATVIVEGADGSKEFRFERGPIFANVVLADEINRATPKTQSAMLEAMQEKNVTVANDTHRLEAPFFVMATRNPLEMEGTYPLPEAQLDRFLFKLNVEFPELDQLHDIMDRTTSGAAPQVEPVAGRDRILQMRELVEQVPVARHVQDYALRILQATHPDRENAPEMTRRYTRFGASPRGAQAMLTAARVRALMEGRFNVSCDDIRQTAAPALRHRVILNFEGEAEGIDPDDIIAEILEAVSEQPS